MEQQFERAVLVQYESQLSREERAAADAFTKSITENEGGWRFVLQHFAKTQHGRVRFHLLNSLNGWIQHRWAEVPPDGRRQAAQLLVSWTAQHIASSSDHVNLLRPKLAQTLVWLFIQEFPQGWPTFFDELLSMLGSSSYHKDMFLRVMDTIDEMVVSKEVERTQQEIARNGKLKDAMRVVMPKIVNAWFAILSVKSENDGDDQLKCRTLSVMRRYVSWIDIGFFASQPFMAMIVQLLALDRFQRHAVKLLAAITEKGMPPLDKLELIRRFGLLQVCRQCRPTAGTRFAVHLSRWVNVLGKCVLEGLAAVKASAGPGALQEQVVQRVRAAEEMLDACVMLMLSCMKSLHRDAALEVIDFATRCVAHLRAAGTANMRPSDRAWLQALLNASTTLLMFDAAFNLDGIQGDDGDEDEELADWLDQREKLSAVFKAVGRLDPLMCTELVRSMAESVVPRHANTAWNAVEIVLYLMMCLGEVLVQEGASEMKKQFRPFLALMLQWDLASNSCLLVAKGCFEVILRYFRYLPAEQPVLQHIIQMTESRGIRHPHPAVRKRAMLTFNKIASLFAHQLVPLIPALIQGLHPLLVPISARAQDGGYLAFQLTLYETLGLLIVQNADDAQQPLQVEAVLGPVAGQLQRLVAAKDAAALGVSHMQLCMMATRYVEVASAFCKGFSGIVNRQNRTKQMFIDVFTMVMALRRKNLGDEDLQQRCLQFMHRMVELLQHEFLQHLEPIVQMLLVDGGVSGAQDFLKLVGQLISRFGTAFQPRLQMILAPLTRRIFDFVAAGEQELARQAAHVGNAVQLSELGREVRELRKSYYGFLLVLTRNKELASVMGQADNVALLEAVLNAVKQGTLWWGNPREQKDCWNIFNAMIDMWAPTVPAFRQWFAREMFPLLLQAPFRDVFPFEQGDYVVVLRAMCGTQRQCFLLMPDELSPALLAHLNSLQCDESAKQQYLAALRGEDPETFIEWYSGFVRRWRKANLQRT